MSKFIFTIIIIYCSCRAGESFPRSTIDSFSVTASPAPGSTITFTAIGSDPLTFTWNFGDFTTLSQDNPATHAYTDSGGYNVSLSGKDASGISTGFANVFAVIVTDNTLDPDRDSVPTAVEIALGTDPNDASSASVLKPVNGAYLPYFVYSTKVKLFTTVAGKDSFSIVSELQLPADFNPAGEKLVIFFGGVVKSFTMTRVKKRMIVTADSGTKDEKISMRLDNLGFAKLTGKFNRGTFLETFKINNSAFGGQGLTQLPIFVVLGNQLYGRTSILEISVRNGVISANSKGDGIKGR